MLVHGTYKLKRLPAGETSFVEASSEVHRSLGNQSRSRRESVSNVQWRMAHALLEREVSELPCAVEEKGSTASWDNIRCY